MSKKRDRDVEQITPGDVGEVPPEFLSAPLATGTDVGYVKGVHGGGASGGDGEGRGRPAGGGLRQRPGGGDEPRGGDVPGWADQVEG